jgi:molybdopterin biosynthesis enzyme
MVIIVQKNILKVEDAVGKILCHDITKIVQDEFKGRLFKKGHVIRECDIEPLRSAGKNNIYVLEMEDDEIHEDDAGTRLGEAAAGDGVVITEPKESRVNLLSNRKGVLKIQLQLLREVNSLPNIVMSTLPTNSVVSEGDMIAATKIIPLSIKENVLKKAEEIMRISPVIQVVPLIKKRVSVIITGNEVYSKRVTDSFAPVLTQKVSDLDSEVTDIRFAPDSAKEIASLITAAADSGAELIMVTGGMSVDPDDVTPLAISMAGAEIVQYGSPVMPGAMFLLGYLKEIPIVGVPACGMYSKATVLDLVLPRILIGERITKENFADLAHGGLCRSCPECHFPNCTFGFGGK